MPAKPRKRPKRRLTVVPYTGTPEGVVDVLSEALVRAQDDQILAVAIIEIRREGEIGNVMYGHEDFRHQLVAGLTYALQDLTAEEGE